ncbi:MAG TPA: type II secretion system protein GspM, partial [Acidimicrobiales bacterium]|nr:type II secretion system protein GspM [Acidimicrobiales bacterium]
MTTQRRNLLIAAGVAVLIMVLWFVLLWSPQTDRLESAREREQVAADQNAQLELELARLRSAAER